VFFSVSLDYSVFVSFDLLLNYVVLGLPFFSTMPTDWHVKMFRTEMTYFVWSGKTLPQSTTREKAQQYHPRSHASTTQTDAMLTDLSEG